MVQIAKLIRKKMGEVLSDEGLLKEDHVQEARRRQRATGESFGEILVSMGFLTESDIARTLVKQSGLPYIDAAHYRINKDGIQAVPAEVMWQNQCIVLDKIGKTLLVAIANVISPELSDKLERASGSQIFVYVSTWSQIQQALEKNVPNGLPKVAPPKPVAAKPAVPGAASGPHTAVRPVPGAAPSGSHTAIRPNPGSVSPQSGPHTTVRQAPGPVTPQGGMPAVARPGTQIHRK